LRFENIAMKLEKVEIEEKIVKSERKNQPVVVVNPTNSDQNSLATGNQIKTLFDP
jgi:hypothetical protein